MRSSRFHSTARAVALASLLAACGEPAIDGHGSSSEAFAVRSEGRAVGHVARVMTRNLYLGADLGPAIAAPDLASFVAATGGVLRQTTATNFPVRAKGLAAEILDVEPDLVGLQEVALWRTGPASIAPLLGAPRTAATVRYDFLQLLLDELNAGDFDVSKSLFILLSVNLIRQKR